MQFAPSPKPAGGPPAPAVPTAAAATAAISMSSVPSPSSVGSHAVSSLLSDRRKSTLAMVTAGPSAGGRQKSASELMLEDAVRWVLWRHSQRALHVSPESKRLLTLERLSVGAQQWLLQVRQQNYHGKSRSFPSFLPPSLPLSLSPPSPPSPPPL